MYTYLHIVHTRCYFQICTCDYAKLCAVQDRFSVAKFCDFNDSLEFRNVRHLVLLLLLLLVLPLIVTFIMSMYNYKFLQ